MKDKIRILCKLFISFAKVGVMTFGGGMAMLPMLQREIVENQNWASEDELTDYFAIGQCTPGIIAVNTATFVGQKVAGIPGAISATLGIIFPSIVIITVIAAFLRTFSDNIYVKYAFSGIRVCVCILIANAAIKFFKTTVKNMPGAIIYFVVLILSVFFKVSPVILVLGAAIVGVLMKVVAKK